MLDYGWIFLFFSLITCTTSVPIIIAVRFYVHSSNQHEPYIEFGFNHSYVLISYLIYTYILKSCLIFDVKFKVFLTIFLYREGKSLLFLIRLYFNIYKRKIYMKITADVGMIALNDLSRNTKQGV
ncbi:hypothetical protein CROQUDRAFT_196048 [Cronartium quercuum f. sp. fusiforme G11]|uniref:Uncharacterized protein n=1 Tax=Cronartium quercuum f. sp. fusiforme G11 TaxID=708437 RepID=A0A9P6TFW8_9BASI|nr:hypothetical protein CROQUDRAFT_196048 [Cronartium quercuum f. sp. fusiforme G11]